MASSTVIVAAVTVPTTATVRTDVIAVAPAAIVTSEVAVIVGAIAIAPVIGDSSAAVANRAAGGYDHEQAGKSGG
jgi:hypothetical protein